MTVHWTRRQEFGAEVRNLEGMYMVSLNVKNREEEEEDEEGYMHE